MLARRGERGQAIVLIALMMAVLVGFVALAIDSARAFDSRRILQDAVDNAALAAAEFYQNNPGSWSAAEGRATYYFQLDNRIYTSPSCSPPLVAPTPGAPDADSQPDPDQPSMICTFGTSNYQLTIAAEDDGPAGQTFALTGQKTLDLALMQVLGQSSTITVKAAGAATASDQVRTPALAGLSLDSSCPGGMGAIHAIHIELQTNYVTVLGDVVSNGSLDMGGLSYLHLAGNALTRCAAPINPTHVVYECWPRGETPSPGCPANEVAGTLYSTTNRLADPGYAAPVTTGTSQGAPANPVILAPGIYTSDPNFSRCYFLQPGVYEWQGGLTVNGGGLISNELKPPSEPGTQFWGTHCAGSLTVTELGGPNPLPAGSYAAVVTSVRSDNGIVRESAPSTCISNNPNGSEVLQVAISNVPGATSYNLYVTARGGTCAGPFNRVSGTITAGAESNSNVTGCPNPAGSPTCSLGATPTFTFDSRSSDVTGPVHPPTAESVSFAGSLPYQTPAPPAFDLANENYCTSLGVPATCPVPGRGMASTAFVTPGAVVMKVTQGTCINVLGGDAYVFSGYQYDWIVNYEPPATTCTNSWNGVYNSDAMGLSYTPGAAFTINGNSSSHNTTGSFEGPMGGIVAGTIHITYSTGLVLDFAAQFAPSPGGARLTG